MCKLFPKALAVLTLPLLTVAMAAGLEAPVIVPAEGALKPIKAWTVTASWYGPGFQGRPTASGQIYDMYAATAAHPWLPLGSLVRVINVKTGQSQIATINDRGPYWEGRELDVSYLLASRLSMLAPGTASVRLELLEEPQRRTQTP